MHFTTAELSKGENYQLMVQGIVPRPIAWISTLDNDGINNLAPYSFFTGVSCNPPVVSVSHITPADGHDKDSLRNLIDTNECVINVVSHDLVEKMNQTSTGFAHGVDEFKEAGIETIASKHVKALGVKAAKIRYECRLREVIRVSSLPSGGSIILLDVVSVFVDDNIYKDNQVDSLGLDAVGKLGGADYSTTRDQISLLRP